MIVYKLHNKATNEWYHKGFKRFDYGKFGMSNYEFKDKFDAELVLHSLDSDENIVIVEQTLNNN